MITQEIPQGFGHRSNLIVSSTPQTGFSRKTIECRFAQNDQNPANGSWRMVQVLSIPNP